MKKSFISKTATLDNSGLYLKRPLTRNAAFSTRSVTGEAEITVQPMTKRRKAIFQGKENIDRKRILEMIEDGNPSGLEILERVSKSPTEFRNLIKLAFDEFVEMKRLQEEDVRLNLGRLKEREPEILKETEEIERKLENLKEEKRKTKVFIVSGEYKLKNLSETAKRLCTLIESDKRKLQSVDDKEIEGTKFVDNKNEKLEFRVKMYQLERDRLEKIFEEKEQKLSELNKTIQELCNMKTIYKPPT